MRRQCGSQPRLQPAQRHHHRRHKFALRKYGSARAFEQRRAALRLHLRCLRQREDRDPRGIRALLLLADRQSNQVRHQSGSTERQHNHDRECDVSNPGGGVASLNSTPQSLQAYAADSHSPYNESYDLDVQQELRSGTVLDIGYYANHSVHLYSNIDLNQPLSGQYVGNTSILPATKNPVTGVVTDGVTAANSTALNVIRPYIGWGPITYSSLQFFSKYNSLQVSLRQRFRSGALATLNYTWSKSLTNSRTPQNNADLASEYGPGGHESQFRFQREFSCTHCRSSSLRKDLSGTSRGASS